MRVEPLHLRAESEDERPLGGVQPGDGQQVVPGPGQAGDEDQGLGVFWWWNSPGLLVAQSGHPGLNTARDLVTSLREGAVHLPRNKYGVVQALREGINKKNMF